jgi:16S rRNA (adenine1518-N6/adenine1519-N6)-dimethyltransferase
MHKARKRFGQNFLHDSNVIHQIIMAISPYKTEHLVEIGPGQGALTEPLLASSCLLDIVELDRDLVTQLEKKYSENNAINIHSADALTFDYLSLVDATKLRIVGNLPYNISTPLLFHLLEYTQHIQDMHFMLQKEIVNRLQAQPGTKQYGRLSIMIQIHCQVDALFDVAPESFEPRPKVMSSIVRLVPYSNQKYQIEDIPFFEKLVTTAFSQRRKTIRNSLKTICSATELEAAGISPSDRAENIQILNYVTLSNQLCKKSM